MKSLLKKQHVQDVFEIFAGHNIAIRIVGGAVRDALLGLEINDIDLCVACAPEETIKILSPHAITKPTGLRFGTVTAVFPKSHFQITSLRKDVKTDGRHAEVIFGGTFEEDALRRDFTMNAISMDSSGELYDYFSGQEDLQKGIVRFIGDPEKRIQEDYLRILRFFRMQAYFGNSTIDPFTIKVCSALRFGLKRLSKERIRLEFFKILIAPHAEIIIASMKDSGILEEIWDSPADIKNFEKIINAEQSHHISPHSLRRLLALYNTPTGDDFGKNFSLSRRESNYLHAVIASQSKNLLEILYYEGKEVALDHVLLYAQKNIKTALSIISAFTKVPCPIKAQDLMDQGIMGELLGNALAKIEHIWIASAFTLTKEELLSSLKD